MNKNYRTLTKEHGSVRHEADAFFKFVSSSDKRSQQVLARPQDVKLRIVHFTDIHIPSEVELFERLRDFVTHHQSWGELAHKMSAIGNAFAHQYRSSRRLYTNILKKALIGFHKLDADHLVITGDLAHCGLEPEFGEMRAILKLTGWWGDDLLTVVPGNHDRFNLYEHLSREPMEKFFSIPSSRNPRAKVLPGGIVLLEIESNCDRGDDRHFAEQWLPNTVGKIYDEELDFIAKAKEDFAGMRSLVVMHHHISDDWHPTGAESVGGFMGPAENTPEMLEALRLSDKHGLVLHGHKHDVMPIDYTFGPHALSCPGGFPDALRANILDLNVNDEITMTQIELRI